MQTPVESNGWRIEDAEFLIGKDGLKPLIARDLCSDEGSNVNTNTTQCPFKTRLANHFPQRISRIGRSKAHIVKSELHKNSQPKYQKGRRVPNNLQARVNTESKNYFKKDI